MSNSSSGVPSFAWGPPDPKTLSFSNCTLAVQFFLSYILEFNYPYEAGGAYLLNGLAPHLKNNSLPDPPLYELAHWYESLRGANHSAKFNSTLSAEMVGWMEGHCAEALCPLLGWQGNPDVAGRGMLVTYVVQALLVAVYLPILLAIRFGHVPRRIRLSPGFGGFVLAVQHSTVTFLNASFIFAISMLIAGIVSCAQLFGDTTDVSGPFLFSLMASYSTIPPLLIHMAASRMLRRETGRTMIWLLISVLIIVMTVLAFGIFGSMPDGPAPLIVGQINQVFWQQNCAYKSGAIYAYPVLGFWATNWILAVVYGIRTVILAFWKRKSNRVKNHWKCWRVLWWVGLVFCFLTMWFILAWFIVFNVNQERKAGASDQESQWSFGQILSLATWVPVVIELAYVWWETPAHAINGKLMDPFEVIDVSKKADDMEELELVDTQYGGRLTSETERLASTNF